jgi:NADH-quinone oxidoreductase subunit G
VLPIAPFTETSGSFVNAEGRLQGFHAVVKPAGDARPAWKVLRVLGNMLGVPGFDFESTPEVLRRAGLPESGLVPADRLGNACGASVDLAPALTDPVVAPIYQLDSIVRRAGSLQLTADARATRVPARQEVTA